MVRGKIQYVHRIQAKRTLYLCTFQVKEGKRPHWSQSGVEVQRFKTPHAFSLHQECPLPGSQSWPSASGKTHPFAHTVASGFKSTFSWYVQIVFVSVWKICDFGNTVLMLVQDHWEHWQVGLGRAVVSWDVAYVKLPADGSPPTANGQAVDAALACVTVCQYVL